MNFYGFMALPFNIPPHKMSFAEGYRSWETMEYTVLEDQVNLDMFRCDPYWAKADTLDEYLRDSLVEVKMNDI